MDHREVRRKVRSHPRALIGVRLQGLRVMCVVLACTYMGLLCARFSGGFQAHFCW